MSNAEREGSFDRGAAVTRSLLGWGVVAGIFYLIVGITLGLTRSGFDFSKHALSQLMVGDFGWAQTVNLILSGLMTVAAAVGIGRAISGSPARWLVGIFGFSLVASGIFPPDAMNGFPPDAASNGASVSGILHLAFGAIGFLCLAASAFVIGGWAARRGDGGLATYSRLSGAVVALGFIGGAAFSAGTLGVVCLWIAVVAGWAWLAVSSVRVYRTVPHPNCGKREAATPNGQSA